jgi:ribose transport system permease protein
MSTKQEAAVKKRDYKAVINSLSMVIVLVVICIVLGIAAPGSFFTAKNISNIFLQTSIYALLTIGATFVIITGGIDLSSASVAAMTGVFAATVMMSTGSIAAGIVVGILVGAGFGFGTGLLITCFKLAPFIVTLGMQMICRGIALQFTDGGNVYGFPDAFVFLGGGTVAGIPFPVIIWIIVLLIAFFILRYTKLGRYTYAIGGNEETVRLSGINTNLYINAVYIIGGVCSAIAGIVLAARLNSAQPMSADGYELDAIAAAVIGGCSLSGGTGNVFGTAVGALIIAVIRNGMNLLNVSSYLQKIVIGAIIIIAVLADSMKHKKKN